MHFLKKGYTLRALHGGIIGAFMLVFITTALLFPVNLHAQDDTKPNLVPIALNEETNDPQALAIAKKLNPAFFYIDKEYMNGSPNAAYYAKFLPLIPDQPKRFFIVTVTNTLYYCTRYGCPFYIYENYEDNKWRLVLSLQTYSMWYDANTAGTDPDNIISRMESVRGQPVSIWMWASNNYIKVNR